MSVPRAMTTNELPQRRDLTWRRDRAPRIDDAEIHLWRLSLEPGEANLEIVAGVLDPSERLRASQFRFEQDRRRFVMRRAALRNILGMYLHRPPAAVRIRRSGLSRPRVLELVDGRELRFSSSHRGDTGLVAVALDRDIGVDIELASSASELEEIVPLMLSSGEGQRLAVVPRELRHRALLRCWTSKEALAKAIGAGLSVPLVELEVEPDPRSPLRVARVCGDPRPSDWVLDEVSTSTNLAATLCYRKTTGRRGAPSGPAVQVVDSEKNGQGRT